MTTMKKGLTLEYALYRYPRVISQDAGGADDVYADVIIERVFNLERLIDYNEDILANSLFSLVVIRNNVVEESMLCRGYIELINDLVKHVHGGRALSLEEEWHSIEDAPIVHQGNLAQLVRDRHVPITRKLDELVDAVITLGHEEDRSLTNLALKFLAEIRAIEENLYQNAGGHS